jgi:molybdate transport system substrate-binding protein
VTWPRGGGPAVALLTAASLLGACGGPAAAPTAGDDGLAGELTVFAAASLTDAFEDLGASFVDAHPDVTVAFNFAGSSTLAAQIVEGAPADVFASADATQVELVADAGLAAGAPTVFATNRLAIAVEAGNPLGIADVDDLARDDLVVVLATPEVPAGRLASQLLASQQLDVTPASLEVDVRAALAKVELGEADAAIVYASDVATASDGVEGVPIPDDRNLVTSYPITTLTDAASAEVADAFVAHVTGPDGQAALEAAGFTAP